MTKVKSFFFSAASLYIVGTIAAQTQTTLNISLNDANKCMSSINEARQTAEFPDLSNGTLFPSNHKDDPFLQSVCSTLLKDESTKIQNTEDPTTSPAIFRLNGESSLDCSAAVKDWQSAFSTFAENPPVKENNNSTNFTNKELSFVTIYNPIEGAQGDCREIICEQQSTAPANPEPAKTREQPRDEVQDDSGHPKEEEEEEDEEEEEEDKGEENGNGPIQGGAGPQEPSGGAIVKKASALICLTSPDASLKSPLFTQQQWEKITKALSSSTSVAAPSFLASAAVLSAALLLQF
ncbi:hypothetical protein Emed_002561 [Eimeria media]